jgi:hypothetical protein
MIVFDFYKIIIFDHYSAGGFGLASYSGGKLGSGCSFLSLHSWRIDSGYLGKNHYDAVLYPWPM